MYDAKVESEVTINVPIDQVWKFLVDPHKVPLVMPSLIGNYNVPELPLKVDSKFNYKYQMFGVVLEGELVVKKLSEPTNYEFITNGDVSSEWVYTLENTGNSTKIHLIVSYGTPQGVVQKVKTAVMVKMNQRETELYLQNLKTVLEMQNE